ncbi:hypothetical protein BU17DRAFT_92988 [Hysterangium stoloniferum]|nr:hypothetical protein BU17DRAFT_92988 [Hysterangium stoloniferum]
MFPMNFRSSTSFNPTRFIMGCYPRTPRPVARRHAATFIEIPLEVFLHISEWLSVRDVLALRMTCKKVAHFTRDSKVWSSLLGRLSIVLPVLPATHRNFFGGITAETYEWLVTRGLYLSDNWNRTCPRVSLRCFEAFSTIIEMKFLPGGKYLVTVMKGPRDIGYALVLWDLEHKNSQIPLAKLDSPEPFMNLDVKYGLIDEATSIIVAFSRPAVETATGYGIPLSFAVVLVVTFLTSNRVSTDISVYSLPLPLMEEIAANEWTLETLEVDKVHCCAILSRKVSWNVSQLALGDFGGDIGLAVLCRPHSILFYCVYEATFSSLLLDTIPITMGPDVGTSIFKIKLLPGQNRVLVARVYCENANPTYSLYFSLELCDIPALGVYLERPKPRVHQYIDRLNIDGVHFSDMEESWFSSLRNPRGLLNSPENDEPPPISIFITSYDPRGVLHLFLRPVEVPGKCTIVQHGDIRRVIPRYEYQLPALCVSRQTWSDSFSCAKILPGVFRSVIWMHPHGKPGKEHLGKGAGVLRMLMYKTVVSDYGGYATSHTTGACMTEKGWPEGPMEVQEEIGGMNENIDPGRSLRIPSLPGAIEGDMVAGTTATAFDESTGKMCVATSLDTQIRLLDFGGPSKHESTTWHVEARR